MERVKTFVNGGRFYPADINSIQDRAAEMLEGTAAAIPSAHFAGRYYRATDTGDLYLDNGTTWKKIAGKEAIEAENVKAGVFIRQESGAAASFMSWAKIGPTGTIVASSGDFTEVKLEETSVYKIIWKTSKSSANYSVTANVIGVAGRIASVISPLKTTDFTVEILNNSFTQEAKEFCVMVLASS